MATLVTRDGTCWVTVVANGSVVVANSVDVLVLVLVVKATVAVKVVTT